MAEEGQARRGLLHQEHLGVEVAGVLAARPPRLRVRLLQVRHDHVLFVAGECGDELLQEELANAAGELNAD